MPYPKYESNDYQSKWKGQYAPCDGPNDKPISSDSDQVITAYQAVPNGFPYPDVGSWEAVGLDGSVCFDRNSRLGPYGLDKSKSKVDFTKVKWGALQNKCLTKNRSRFEKADAPTLKTGIGTPDFDDRASKNTAKRELEPRANTPFKARNAVLIRTWDNYQYQENDLQAIRSLVSELSLQSGAEYHVFLFVNIKDTDTPIFSDGKAYNEALEKYVPAEFRDMAILWTEDVCQQWYSKIGEWSVYWQQFMPLQWFSRTHPEFDYVWNWEMDARYIGQHYDFMEKISSFAKKQPRKFIWERNSRYYIPAQHGDWANFTSETNRIVQQAKGAHQMHTVWGPEPWAEEQTEHIMGSQPPRNEDQDNFEWGVDEEADFITLLPLWDPRETWWSYRDKLFNYPGSEQATEERPYPHVPRRVFINTFVRFSTKLLDAMHYENSAGLSMASEMWPGTIALQHGFKAVYAPHPIWQSHVWPADFMEITFNADGWGAGSKPGHNIDDGRGVMWDQERQNRGEEQAGTGPNKEGKLGRWGQERDSPYNPDREHNFAGWSWYFWSDFPRIIYWRWLGWKAGFSIVTIGGRKVTDELGLAGGADVSFAFTWVKPIIMLTIDFAVGE